MAVKNSADRTSWQAVCRLVMMSGGYDMNNERTETFSQGISEKHLVNAYGAYRLNGAFISQAGGYIRDDS